MIIKPCPKTRRIMNFTVFVQRHCFVTFKPTLLPIHKTPELLLTGGGDVKKFLKSDKYIAGGNKELSTFIFSVFPSCAMGDITIFKIYQFKFQHTLMLHREFIKMLLFGVHFTKKIRQVVNIYILIKSESYHTKYTQVVIHTSFNIYNHILLIYYSMKVEQS